MKRFTEQLWSEAISLKINIILVVLCMLYTTQCRQSVPPWVVLVVAWRSNV